MNCGDLIACPRVIPDCGSSGAARTRFSEFNAGGRRTSNATGIMTTAVSAARICREVLQSWLEMSRAANGDMVIGAIPMPAETRDTARLRCVSNQPVTQAIMGAKMAAGAPPTPRRRSAETQPAMSPGSPAPALWPGHKNRSALSGAGRSGPTGFPRRCFPMPWRENRRSWRWICPVMDHPVSREMGRRKTGSENMAPIATQPKRPPTATITQRY